MQNLNRKVLEVCVRYSFVVCFSSLRESTCEAWTNVFLFYLNLPVPISDEEENVKLNFYFNTSLWWCLKKFEGLKGIHKTF